MKARIRPIFFDPGRDEEFDIQLEILRSLFHEKAKFLDPAPLVMDSFSPHQNLAVDAVVFPQLLGEAYRQVDVFKMIHLPILIITSEFGTVSMWDWEICSYLRSEGLDPIAPNSLDKTRKVIQALCIKRGLQDSKFLVFQDNPGEGMQAEIFKRFYWWEDECIQRIKDKFGLTIEKRSFEKLAADAKAIPDKDAEEVWEAWKDKLVVGDITQKALLSALKIYMAVKRELENNGSITAVGMNCLNESRYSDTTPCLAWNMLYEEQKMIWGCEADIVSMLTKYILNKSLDVPIMMTNIYPFLMGQAALKHERIPGFPEVDDPQNHILVAHCGYLGVVPQSFATDWSLEKKVLAIVDDNAIALDARLPEGDMTLAKLFPTMEKMTVAEGDLSFYIQYSNSDCLNGGIIRVANGYKLLNTVSSHHYLLMTGHNLDDIEAIAKVFKLEIEAI